MEEWRGDMNWPVDINWMCEFCGNTGSYSLANDKEPNIKYVVGALEWGLVHATCRCTRCHVPYRMRDGEQKIVTTPLHMIKVEYARAVKILWNESGIACEDMPLDRLNEIAIELGDMEDEHA
jgi:hypothetical protein